MLAKITRYLPFLFCLLCWWPIVDAQELRFERAFPNEELPQIPNYLFQDSKGFLWIGTTDGLCRYDGRSVKEFRYDSQDTTTLSNNFINQISEDQDGRIWVATRFGLNCYIPETESFVRYIDKTTKKREEGNYINTLELDSKGFIWYGTYNGLFRLEPSSGERLHFLPEVENAQTINSTTIWSVFEDQKNRLWIGGMNGLSIYHNDGTYEFQPYLSEPESESGLQTERIFSFAEQSNGTMWISSDYGLFKVEEEQGELRFQHVQHDEKDTTSLSSNFIESLYIDPHDRLWAGTWNKGLNVSYLDQEGNSKLRFKPYKHDSSDPTSISMNRVGCMIQDASGMVWVGTGNGLDKITEKENKFHAISHHPKNNNSLCNNIVKSFCEDSFGNLWIGTYNGLNFLQARKFTDDDFEFEIFLSSKGNTNSLSNNNINGIYEDSNGYLWIATMNGLNYVKLTTFKEKPIFHKLTTKEGLPHDMIHNVLEISRGTYWVTTNRGLVKMTFNPEDPKAIKIKIYTQDNDRTDALVNGIPYDVIQDGFGSYWVGTYHGLSKYVVTNSGDLFDNYKNDLADASSLSHNSIRCLFKDSSNRLWIGTRGGLNLVLQNKKEDRARFKVFGIRDGLPNDVIHAIEEDEAGLLWLTTNRGLVQFDPEEAEKGSNPVLKVYDKQDGLLSSSFVFRSSLKDKKGRLFFGTANGFNFFYPSYLPSNQKEPVLVFTKIKVLNETLIPGKGKPPVLPQSITLTDTLYLKYWENIIEVEFAALDYTNPAKNKYQYRLLGFNDQWLDNGFNNSVTFTNLSVGTYELQVKGSNNDGLWNESPSVLHIVVVPPIWKTGWAYAAYGLFVALLLYAFIRFRVKHRLKELEAQTLIEKVRIEERETLREKNTADFHDELGHRLTRISLFLELAERQKENHQKVGEYLFKIKTNMTSLSDGVRDFIWSLDPKKDSLYQTAVRLQEFGDKLFEYTDTHFKVEGISTDLEMVALDSDVRKQVLLIFKEAMNNCLKYAQAETAVLYFETKTVNEFSIRFQDNGIGFDDAKVKSGYGLKNMKKRATQIKATLSINAQHKKGTTITLDIKIPHMG